MVELFQNRFLCPGSFATSGRFRTTLRTAGKALFSNESEIAGWSAFALVSPKS